MADVPDVGASSTGGVENARMTFIVAPEEARRKRRAATRSPG